MTRLHSFGTVTILTIAMAMVHAAEAAAQMPTDRRTSIGASVYFEVPAFSHLNTPSNEGGPSGLSPGVSVHVDRMLTSRVGVGLEVDLSAAHDWRGTVPTGETESIFLPRVQSFRFNTFSPVIRYQIASAGRWEFVVSGGLAFAHIRTADERGMFSKPDPDLEAVENTVDYSVGLTTGFSVQLRATDRLTFVADVRATSLSFAGYTIEQGFVIRSGAGMRFRF